MMHNPMVFAMNMLRMNPQLRNNPQAQEWLQVIQSGDSARGEELANNILQSIGMTKEQAMQEASKRFGFPL